MTRPPESEKRRRRAIRLVWLSLALAVTGLVGYLAPLPVAATVARTVFWLLVAVTAGFLLFRAYQRLLWHVSGRLAFSYLLIGALPIPLAAILLALVGYFVAGFFLGHLYRDTLHDLERQVEAAAAHAEGGSEGEVATPGAVAWAAYREGRRVAGDPRAPERWPTWLDKRPEGSAPAFATLPDGSMTLVASTAAGDGRRALAFVSSDLSEVVRRRSGVWVNLLSNAGGAQSVQVSVGSAGLHVRLDPVAEDQRAEIESAKAKFFEQRQVSGGWRDRPMISWVELGEPARSLATGETALGETAVVLTATPRILAERLFSPSAEVGRTFWVSLIVVSLLLLSIYALAELVAVSLIVGLSRAVSRLYTATSRVSAGDFSVRIPVRRRDQVGALQRSFNGMAENLEDLVATAAQAELLEKELTIARQVQQSLIPTNLPEGEAVEFSTLFEPSAAIGGDYFDVLRLSDHELAVVVADVSGHGLPTGLRMAMVKAALGILVVETQEADEILRRLDGTVRSGDPANDEARFFVTATFAKVDFREGRMELTNAGHPPTYHLRGGEVEEIVLPGSPLGGLGTSYGHATRELESGDAVIWLSDGLIEASDAADEPFGYDQVRATLAGPCKSAAQVRDRLLAAVEAHTGGRPARDDRTLVVMRYR